MKKSIKTRLITTLIIVIALPLLVLGTISFINSRQSFESSYKTSNAQVVDEITQRVQNYLKTFETAAEVYAMQSETIQTATSDKRNYSRETLLNDFQKYVDSNEDVLYVYMGTNKKEMIDPSWPDVPDTYDPTSREWYIKAKEAMTTIWTEPYVDEQSGALVVSVATPVTDKGKLLGVISIDITLERLSNLINDMSIGQTGYPILIGQDMTIMTHRNEEKIGTEVSEDIVKLIANEASGQVTFSEDGIMRLGNYSRIPSTNWIVLGSIEASELGALTLPILKTTVILIIVCLFIGTLIAIMISRSITKPIHALEATMNIVKNGDLTCRSDVKVKNEFGRMSDSFNTMIDSFSDMLKKSRQVTYHVSSSANELNEHAVLVNQTSEEVARTIEEIAKGSSDQALETEKGVILIDQLSKKIQELNANSTHMADSANQVKEANDKGQEVIETLKAKTHENNTATDNIAMTIQALEMKSVEIGGILETITAVAEQTNLLALNASIEAARAGEHGRGFAVVAEEIRKLAEGSNEAAENIKVIVSEIQSESRHAVDIMNDVKARNSEQNEAVNAVHEVFMDVHDSTDTIAHLIFSTHQFVKSMNEEKQEIVSAIENISAVSEESAAAAEQVTASVLQQTQTIRDVYKSANKLNDMADSLKSEINLFKIEKLS
ncbi:methyl-accepting chemotaxis protein [Acidaminobacter sp. JC074]|uniref:methyl-accepting chemotaxis protein n=1 Tax=Acidaminobacter sp. JC074 TaxID=2530199 RepID=UPI001F0EBC12|nr:methyl-accepting chemotaxis protein [Acidaminobacter sp. JC074]MCH4887228.1 methyl-accepting chemotaxis protein [Acidaminobacter sp. JC074]